MSNLTREQKKDYLKLAVVDLLGQATNGALLFDVAFDECFDGEITHSDGKAFTTDGINFFGYIDKEGPSHRNFEYSDDRLFAGTYVDGKGMSISMLPFSDILLEIASFLDLTATNKPNNEYMHGKSPMGETRVKADFLENATEKDVSEVMGTFVEMLAHMTREYPDLAYDMIQKGQRCDIPYIEMIYDKFKDIPVPKCFADDGAPSNGPAK